MDSFRKSSNSINSTRDSTQNFSKNSQRNSCMDSFRILSRNFSWNYPKACFKFFSRTSLKSSINALRISSRNSLRKSSSDPRRNAFRDSFKKPFKDLFGKLSPGCPSEMHSEIPSGVQKFLYVFIRKFLDEWFSKTFHGLLQFSKFSPRISSQFTLEVPNYWNLSWIFWDNFLYLKHLLKFKIHFTITSFLQHK